MDLNEDVDREVDEDVDKGDSDSSSREIFLADGGDSSNLLDLDLTG